jgi:glycosyltransferase involved in cell wall biosynthesis
MKFYYEYILYKKISYKVNPDIWISLNDFTPNVKAKKVFTYFHNAAIFFNLKWSDFLFSRRIIFQKIYYNLLLKFNLKKNEKFIVQQTWIAKKISEKYNVPLDFFLIFRPNNILENTNNNILENTNNNDTNNFIIFYPTKAVGYKNIELICEALKVLIFDFQTKNVELRITIDKNENLYSRYLRKKYLNLPIVWLGTISKEMVEKNYYEASVLVFPSRLETWGLPLTEFSKYKKPILAINLGYVYETLYDYPYLSIFEPDDSEKLAELLKDEINRKKIDYYQFKYSNDDKNQNQSINNWEQLLTV